MTWNPALVSPNNKQRYVVLYKHPETLRMETLEVEADSAIDAVDVCARTVRSKCALPGAQVSVVEIRALRLVEPASVHSNRTPNEHVQSMAESLALLTGGVVLMGIYDRDLKHVYVGLSGEKDDVQALEIAFQVTHEVKFRNARR